MKTIKYIFTVLAVIWLIVTTGIMIPVVILLFPLLFISKRHFSEWLLFSFAIISALGIYPIGFIYQIIKWKGFLIYLRKLNLSIDISGNMIAGALLNDNFINKDSKHPFGFIQETISDNLGENERDNTLSTFGKRFTNLLSVIDFNHAKKSIIED